MHEPLQASVFTKKIQVTIGIFHGVLRESIVKLSYPTPLQIPSHLVKIFKTPQSLMVRNGEIPSNLQRIFCFLIGCIFNGVNIYILLGQISAYNIYSGL